MNVAGHRRDARLHRRARRQRPARSSNGGSGTPCLGPGEFGQRDLEADDLGRVQDRRRRRMDSTGSYDPGDQPLRSTAPARRKPWGDPEFRPGDNLFASSAVALDADTGKLPLVLPGNRPATRMGPRRGQRRACSTTSVDQRPRRARCSGPFLAQPVLLFHARPRPTAQFIKVRPVLTTPVNWTKAASIAKTGKPVEYDPEAARRAGSMAPAESLRAARRPR